MSTNTDNSHGDGGSFAQLSRHDLLLAAMPIPLLVGATIGTATAVSLTVALWVGSLLSLPLLCYAVFVNPPAPASSFAEG